MALQSSGAISVGQIYQELNPSTGTPPVAASLGYLAIASDLPISQNQSGLPAQAVSFSHFYGYEDTDSSCSSTPYLQEPLGGTGSQTTRYFASDTIQGISSTNLVNGQVVAHNITIEVVINVLYSSVPSPAALHGLNLYRNNVLVDTIACNSTDPLSATFEAGDTIKVAVQNGFQGTTFQADIQMINRSHLNQNLGTAHFSHSNTSQNLGCFPGHMRVLMADGTYKEISKINVGEQVIGGDGTPSEVLDVHQYSGEEKTIYTINDRLKVTESHPIATDDGWKCFSIAGALSLHPDMEFGLLRVGDELETRSGHSAVHKIEADISTETVYNLDVSGDDTYYVEEIRVHNK